MLAHFIILMVSLVFVAIGIKAIFTRRITLFTSLWNSSPTDFPSDNRGTWARSELSGFGAVLVGLAHVGLGIALLLKGPGFFQ